MRVYTFELSDKANWKTGRFFEAAFHRLEDDTLTRIQSIVPNSTIVYAIM